MAGETDTDGTKDTTAPPGGEPPPKTDPDKKADSPGDTDDKKADAPKVPDKYDFTIKGDDGKPIEIDPETVTAFVPVLKELGITQEGLSKLMPLYHKELARQDNLISEMYTAQRDAWEAAAKADKDFGGVHYDDNVKVSQAAMARFGTPALKTLLNETGLGNHIEVLRFFEKIGRQISEDRPTLPPGEKPDTGDAAKKLFDHPTSQGMT